jgi:chitinase
MLYKKMMQSQAGQTPAATSAQTPPCYSQTYCLPEKILCGFWFGWSPRVPLANVPSQYNLICVAFLEPDGTGIPIFRPIDQNDVINGVKALKAAGKTVIVSIGGANDDVYITQSNKARFRDELMATIDKYGFMGVDLDLEGASVTAGANQTVIPEVLRELKDYYRSIGQPFVITLAPEFNLLRGANAPYKPIIQNLEGYYDLILSQFYNQGADGIWDASLNMYLSQNDNSHKKEFLYALTHAIVTGTSDYLYIPSNKFLIGLPASTTAALNGYVQNASDVEWAMRALAAEGNPIRGLMTWSINQDSVNGYQFMNRYAPIIERYAV